MKNSSINIVSDTYERSSEPGTSLDYFQEKAKELSLRPLPDGHRLNGGTYGVLIIDDNPFNGTAIKRSFDALHVFAPIFEVRTCGGALDALRGEHSRINTLPPCVLLLNLDMPQSFEFLKELRQDTNKLVRNAIVFVHSKSNSESDHDRAYEWNVAGYIHDRPGRKSMLSLARLLQEYIRAVRVPDRERSIVSHHTPSRRAPDVDVQTSHYVRPTLNPSYPARATTGLNINARRSSFESMIQQATTRSLGHVCPG